MNCKPGDMAMIVRGNYPQFYGRIIAVHNLVYISETEHCWSYSGNLHVNGFSISYVEDSCLRPIRDPGDDAVDEMVQLCGNATARTA